MMARIQTGRPEITPDPAHHDYSWRCWVRSLDGVHSSICQASGRGRTLASAAMDVYAHLSVAHRPAD